MSVSLFALISLSCVFVSGSLRYVAWRRTSVIFVFVSDGFWTDFGFDPSAV